MGVIFNISNSMKHCNTYCFYPNTDATLNIFDWMTIIAITAIITKIMEYLNPAEYDPVVILPKNNPDSQDCAKIAIPNNSKRAFDSI